MDLGPFSSDDWWSDDIGLDSLLADPGPGEGLEAALRLGRAEARLCDEHCYALLAAWERGDSRVAEALSVQKTASPIYPGRRRTVLVCKTAGDGDSPPPPSERGVSVVFQSVLNARLWWSPDDPDSGVALRPLGRRRVARAEPDAADTPRLKGRLCSLVRRFARDGDASDSDRDFEVVGTAHVLQFWEDGPGERAPPPSRASGRKRGAETVFDGSVRIVGDLEVSGTIRARDMATVPGSQDFAEFFPFGDACRKNPPGPGAVVRLAVDDHREPRLELDTEGPGPVLVVSSAPALAAGAHGAAQGAACAFVGVVPVRCRGHVRAGDRLVPSGLGDGVARCAVPGDADDRVLGLALHRDRDGLVPCCIRWCPRERRSTWRDAARLLLTSVKDDIKAVLVGGRKAEATKESPRSVLRTPALAVANVNGARASSHEDAFAKAAARHARKVNDSGLEHADASTLLCLADDAMLRAQSHDDAVAMRRAHDTEADANLIPCIAVVQPAGDEASKATLVHRHADGGAVTAMQSSDLSEEQSLPPPELQNVVEALPQRPADWAPETGPRSSERTEQPMPPPRAHEVDITSTPAPVPATWACGICTFENARDEWLACEACGSPRDPHELNIPEYKCADYKCTEYKCVDYRSVYES